MGMFADLLTEEKPKQPQGMFSDLLTDTEKPKEAESGMFDDLLTQLPEEKPEAKTGIFTPAKELIKGLVSDTESGVVGGFGSMTQWAAERTKIGALLNKHIGTPGAGIVAEYLVRKFGPKKPVEFYDKQMDKYSKNGEKWADWWNEQANKGWEAPNEDVMEAKWSEKPFSKAGQTIGRAAPSYLIAIAASVVTKNPQVGLLFMSAQSGGAAYAKQRKKGTSKGMADLVATATAAWEYVTEKIPFDEVFKPTELGRLAKATKIGSLEGLQESVQGLGENFLEHFGFNAKDLESVPLAVREGVEHSLDGWLDNFIGGFGMGFIGGGATGDMSNKPIITDQSTFKTTVLTPEGAKEFAKQEPVLAVQIAEKETPSRKDLKKAGITGSWNIDERSQLSTQLREALAGQEAQLQTDRQAELDAEAEQAQRQEEGIDDTIRQLKTKVSPEQQEITDEMNAELRGEEEISPDKQAVIDDMNEEIRKPKVGLKQEVEAPVEQPQKKVGLKQAPAGEGELTPAELAIGELGSAQVEVSKKIGQFGYGGISESEQHPELVKASKIKRQRQNDLYDALEPEYKIGDTVTYQRFSPAGSHNVATKQPDGTFKEQPSEEKTGKPIEVKIISAEFDISQSADTNIKEGFPSTFKLTNLNVEEIGTGDKLQIGPSDLVNGSKLSETIKIKPEDALKSFVKKQKGIKETPSLEHKRKQIAQPTEGKVGLKPPAEKTVATANTKAEVDKVAEELTSARQADVEKTREDLGMPKMPSKERVEWQQSLDDARKQGLPERATGLALDVNVTGRSFNTTETAGMVIAASRLKGEHRRIGRELRSTVEPAATKMLSAQYERIESELEALLQALHTSGTEKGRTLAAQKLTINDDLDLASVKIRAKASKGSVLNIKELDWFKKTTDKLEETVDRVTERVKKLEEVITNETFSEAKKNKRAKRINRTELGNKINKLLQEGCL